MKIASEDCPGYSVSARVYSRSDMDTIALAMSIIRSKLICGDVMNSPDSVSRYLAMHFAGKQREEFLLLMLDSQHRLMATETLAVGTINAATLYPREVVRAVMSANAASVILAHNHPSGLPEPSAADRAITSRLVDALSLIDVRVLDHVVVGGDSSVSFAARGWI